MESTELDLVNKVELRIALANTDAQLENSLKLYLGPVILKLSSSHSSVRQAVFKIIQNVMTRLGAARDIKLPADALLEQVKKPSIPQGADASTVRLYLLLFISKAVERMNNQERRGFFPKVIKGISNFQSNVSARLFNIFCKSIIDWKSPEVDTPGYNQLIEDLDFKNHIEDEKFLCEKVSKFLMLLPNPNPAVVQSPGLSIEDASFLTRDAGVSFKTPQDIFKVKKNLLEFLKVGFTNENLRIPLLVASSDPSSAIADGSEVLYRKLNVNLEDEHFVESLISLFTGDDKTPPVNSVLQERIINQLNKSVIATKNIYISKITNLGLSSDNSKLKQATIQFVKWVSINNQDSNDFKESMVEFNSVMALKLKENIMNEGWPQLNLSNGKSYATNMTQRSSQYEALTNILKTSPDLFLNDFTYIEFLLDSLEGESVDLRSTIQEGLSSLTVFLPRLSPECKSRLKTLANNYLNNEDSKLNIHACRFIILKFINCTFPFNDSESRYLNILGTSKVNRPETIEEAVKGLHPHWFNINQSSNTLEFKSTPELLGKGNLVQFPSFKEIVTLVNNRIEDSNKDAMIYKSLSQAIKFCIQTLVMQSIEEEKTVVIADEEWETRLDKAVEVDTKVRDLLKIEIKKVHEDDIDMDGHQDPFKSLLFIIFDALNGQYEHPDTTFESTFSRLISLASSSIVGGLSDLVDPLLRLLNDRVWGDISVSQISQIIAIIASHPVNDNGKLNQLLQKLIQSDLPPHKAKANTLVCGYLYSRLTYRQRIDVIEPELFSKYLEKLVVSLKDSSAFYVALESIGELAKYGVLGPQLTFKSDDYINQILEIIKPKVKKCDERTVLTLSYLNLTQEPAHEDKMTDLEQMIYETHVSKQTEYLFTSGEAWSIVAMGWESKVLQRSIDIQDEEIKYIPYNTGRLEFILDQILIWCANTKPSLRRAGCIWLLSIVEFCKSSPIIKTQASKIHLTFMKFLADRDELVQEAASRGLSLVYELGDVELKDTLVKGLLKSFTDTNTTSGLISGTVEEDTELFDKDILKTNDGSVSTYRDVLNLAADVGDPSLVYKFMSLAKSSALWSSRKGMAFGLGSILSKTSLDDMLTNNKKLADRLIPKLYRYRYDPSTSVSTSMNEIWNVLIEDSSKTIQENFSNILQELLKGMGNKEWRVRQASTTAMNDLLNVVEFKVYQDKLEEIWNMSFRVMDDIKESVRKEGSKLTKLLANILTKSSKDEGLKRLIPFLLGNKGLLSDADDIRNFALDTLLKLIKSDNKSITKFIPLLLENFILLMSNLEPEIVNYLVLNADKYNVTGNEIDAKRLQSLGNSPMMEAIDKLIDLLDFDTIEPGIESIINSIKKSIGLPSKVCGSKVLVSLVTKKYELIKPYGDKLMKLAMNQIKDKNDTISASYSISVGYLSRLANLDLIIKYGEMLSKLYFESEDDRNRLISSIANENFAKYSKEKFEKVSSLFLPICFIGLNDINKDVSGFFEREWIENTSGSNVIKLYLSEIIELMSKYITSPNYHIRQILAKSIVKITNEINDFNNISDTIINQMFEILISSCKGKSWSGKELIFEALVNFSIKLKSKVGNYKETIDKVVLVEGKRRNKEYQKHSIKIMGKYLYNFPNEEMIDTYLEIMSSIISGNYNDSDDEMDVDDDNSKRINKRVNNNQIEEEKLVYMTNLFETFSKDQLNEELFKVMVESMIKLLNDEDKTFEITWRSKVNGNDCFQRVIEELDQVEFQIDNLFKLWLKLHEVCSNFNNIENVKVRFIRNSKLFIKYLENFHYLEIVKEIETKLQNFSSDSSIIKAELMK
ncbi:proteasome component Ecm29p [[Candida] jaroonii]|uniref:Proteasome component Ecm29p n=1 Tax=[Candida] jaroonii TaxID=467808 RepID=A0ACA9Y2D7_9ASCO|nr:proteasome component Ecm29p [[Candida] jaroonii]